MSPSQQGLAPGIPMDQETAKSIDPCVNFIFTFWKSPTVYLGAETMSSSTMTSQNEGKSTKRQEAAALLPAWYILCGGSSSSLRDLLISRDP